ncbi:MAG TPA: SCO1664 family protein [Caldilineaceae bacterium]|nr:SCO1664 family protein [Caldilineaceae bacterium]
MTNDQEADEAPIQLTEAQVVKALTKGKMTEQGLLPYSSNHSFLVTISDEELTLPAVYKPRRGESPLWDFEWGSLCLRETAAYHISHSLGWNLVPPTVLREGSRGLGSVQFYIANEDNEHYFTVQEDARFAPALRRLALFDFVINNADRKSGHCLVGLDRRLWAIDHGVCFHTEYKLRTVIWEFSGEPIDDELAADLERLAHDLEDEQSELARVLCHLLNPAERAALLARVRSLLRSATFPTPSSHRRNYPWPPI